MKQIYYVIQALIHGRGANIIKVVSLGLGLTMSILLFSRVVYEQSFDTCFKDHDKLYQLWNIWTVNGEPLPPSEYIIGAAAGGILDAMPEIVESAASAGIWPARGRFRHLFITGVSALMILKLLLIHCFFRQWVLRS